MARIFISYSRRDLDLMHRLRDYLRAGGLDIWTDEALEPGTPSWQDAIQTAMESSAALVVILSPDARKSEWVKRELNYASALNLRIFPVLARGTDKDAVPLLLASAQYVDLRTDTERGLELLRHAVHQHAGEPLPAAPTAQPPPSSHPRTFDPDSLSTPPAAEHPQAATPPRARGLSPVLIAGVAAALALAAGIIALRSNSEGVASVQQTQDAALLTIAAMTPQLNTFSATQTVLALLPTAQPTTAPTHTPEATKTPTATNDVSAGAGSPDLIITDGQRLDISTTPGEVFVGVTVVNQGSARAEAFSVGGQLNGSAGHQTVFAGPLAPGETTPIQFADTFDAPGDYDATFVLDPANAVQESDEDNNAFTLSFSVTPDDLGSGSARFEALRDPPGPQIAYASARDGDYELYVYDLSTESDFQITDNTCDDTDPSWSPDGQELAYISNCDSDGNPELFRIDVNDRIPIQISYAGAAHRDPLWLSDGYIAFISDETGQLELYVIRPDGTDGTQISDESGVGRFGFTFSPDARQRIDGVEQGDEADLFLYDPQDDTSMRLTTSFFPDRDPAWSPDGVHVAYIEDRGSESGVYKLHVLDLDSGHDAMLLEITVPDPAPAWSPLVDDATRPVLALIYYDGEHQGIFRFDPDTGDLKRLVHDSEAADPDWRPGR